jgi:uncharacterized repeat protein (TIGR01451 family)
MTGWSRTKLGRIFLCLVVLVFAAVAGAGAAPAPAGALVEAQAFVTYFDARLQQTETISSNVVTTKVARVKRIDVVFDQTVYLAPASFGHFVFHVRNIGNTPVRASITFDQLTGDDYDLDNVVIFVDQNGNGFADAGEEQLAAGGFIDLSVAEERALIAQFRTPPALSDGDRALLRLTATDEGASGSATGTAVISSTGLAIEKFASLNEVPADGKLRYLLRLRNRGINSVPAYAAIDGNPISIDGAPASGILVRDSIPLNTRFSSFISTNGLIALYHVAGQPRHSYTTAAPQDLSSIDAIAFFRPGDYPTSFSPDLSFEVTVSANASSGVISNIASTWQHVPAGLVELKSNIVRTKVEGPEASLSFINPEGAPISTTALDTNVRLRLSASACNATSGIDSVDIRITTDPEGDVETVVATETGPNTGIFITPLIPVHRVLPAVHGDNVLSGDRNTRAHASVSCGGQVVSATLRINPGGFVFHSSSNAGVSGATVIVYDGTGAELEHVVSDGDGFYVLSAVTTAGAYRIVVLPPEGLAFPSTRTAFPGWGRNLHADASFGRPFTTQGAFAGVDIPLDADRATALKLEKSVDVTEAAPGDILRYTLQLTNNAEQAVTSAIIRDFLPAGISYIKDTAQVDGGRVAISGGEGRELSLSIDLIDGKAAVKLTYMAQVDAMASGKLANIAYAEGALSHGRVRSNDARAVVRVRRTGGVFSEEGIVLGKVYVDFNGNGLQDHYIHPDGTRAMEPGIPGVKIYFENGASVVTDSEGKYSMPGLSPEAHAAAVSVRTLPFSVELKSTSTRDLLSPQSRLIRLLPGQVVSEYFAVFPKPGFDRETVLAELQERSEAYAAKRGDGSEWSSNLPAFGDQWVDYALERNGEDGKAALATVSEIILREARSEALPAATGSAREPRKLARSRNLEAEIPGMSPELAFVDLRSEDLLNDDVISIRIKGPAAGRLGLNLNGQPVPDSLVGQRVVHAAGGVQAAEYVAVRLKGGRNRLELTFADPFGNVRERQEIEVLAPGRPVRIELVVPPVAIADPASPIPVLIRLVDADGLPTFASMDVTLEAGAHGEWRADDIRSTEPGIQIFLSGGEALVDYHPPALAGSHTIAVRSGLGRFETEVKLLPDDSEQVIVGVLEGVVRLRSGDLSTDGIDGFEKMTTGLRGALYLKGKIKGDALLTLRYDSNRNTEERLFRDIDPEQYYPVYGDASERGFDAQSKTQLYVKVEKGLNYLLYGDINIAPQASEFRLGSYSRLLTGAQAHLETGPVTINLFAGRTDQNQVIREFRAEGLSGPYDLDLSGYVEGSERVEVVTRDRRQSSIVLRTTPLQRYTDYRLDYFDGAILFTAPVPAMDEESNPNFIRVTYELDGAHDSYWVYAGELRYRVNDHIAVGYREVHSDADAVHDDRRTMRAAYAAVDLGKGGKVEVEMAQSVDRLGEQGLAGRVAYEVSNDRLTLRARASHMEAGFLEGTSSRNQSGRSEASVEADLRVNSRLMLKTSLLYDRETVTGDERWGAEGLAKFSVGPEFSATMGLRYLHSRFAGGDRARSVPSAVVGGEWRPSSYPGFALRGEIEGDLIDMSHLRGLVEASHQATERLKLYASADWASTGSEFIDFSSADGMRANMKMGAEYRLTDQISSFTEARDGSQTGLAGGLKGEWKRGENARLYASVEHFQPYALRGSLWESLRGSGTSRNDSPQTSLAAGYLAELNERTGRLGLTSEISLKDGGYTVYQQQYWSQRIGDWTWALENRFAWADTDGGRRLRDHFRGGAALRPEGESIDALFMGGLRVDRDFTADTGTTTGYWSAAGSMALGPDLNLTGKQAGQYQQKTFGDISAETFLLLVQLGLEKELMLQDKLRMRIGVNAPVFYDAFKEKSYAGVGGEVGFVPMENTLLSLGYNWSGVHAESVSEIYQTGPYVRFTMKLDDSAWGFFERAGLTVPVGAQPGAHRPAPELPSEPAYVK